VATAPKLSASDRRTCLFEFELTPAAAELSGMLRNALKFDEDEESEGRQAIASPSLKEKQGPVDLDRVGKIGLEGWPS
jgi:hypothetical protein